MCSFVIFTKMTQFLISLSVVWAVMDRVFQLVLTGLSFILHLSLILLSLSRHLTILFCLTTAIYSVYLVVPRVVLRPPLWKPVKTQWGNFFWPHTNFGLVGILAFIWNFHFLRRQVPTPSRPSRSLGNSITRVARRSQLSIQQPCQTLKLW